MKTNPWLLVLHLFESEAVPAKQSLSNIQHLWQQVRIAYIACVLLNQYIRVNQPKKANHKASATAEITITLNR